MNQKFFFICKKSKPTNTLFYLNEDMNNCVQIKHRNNELAKIVNKSLDMKFN